MLPIFQGFFLSYVPLVLEGNIIQGLSWLTMGVGGYVSRHDLSTYSKASEYVLVYLAELYECSFKV